MLALPPESEAIQSKRRICCSLPGTRTQVSVLEAGWDGSGAWLLMTTGTPAFCAASKPLAASAYGMASAMTAAALASVAWPMQPSMSVGVPLPSQTWRRRPTASAAAARV
jgi:hypothetical protein